MSYFIKITAFTFLVSFLIGLPSDAQQRASTGQPVTILLPANAHARVVYGADKLKQALNKLGYQVQVKTGTSKTAAPNQIVLGLTGTSMIGKEGFSIQRATNKPLVITGADASGLLYGCLELADRLAERGELPETISVTDKPEMVLRGTCIGIQKPTYLPAFRVGCFVL
ncbi:MAG: hypothetical protein EOO39_35930 [Cytophagaceae bacterium]|nr:MAG: hypothetical protein EOO39_35930 [Cytophagaceae bacterium]